MKPLLVALALLACPAVASAAPYEAPEAYCHDRAESAYQLAITLGDGLPDATYERVWADCDREAYRAHLFASPQVSLNELVAFDQIDGERCTLLNPSDEMSEACGEF